MQQVGPSTFELINKIETPIKKIKGKAEVEPNTAESDQKVHSLLEDIEAKQLFEKFDEIVRITEQKDEMDEERQMVCRKLNYEGLPFVKLDFEFKSSSMKKKPYSEFNQMNSNLQAINLFKIQSEEGIIEETNCPEILKTPPKKQMNLNKNIELAAKKQQPYKNIVLF